MSVYFRKVWSEYGQEILLLLDGSGKPILSLEDSDVKSLNKEWKTKQQEGELFWTCQDCKQTFLKPFNVPEHYELNHKEK
jgi:hypothetical protein